jgi:hypothetical protein
MLSKGMDKFHGHNDQTKEDGDKNIYKKVFFVCVRLGIDSAL